MEPTIPPVNNSGLAGENDELKALFAAMSAGDKTAFRQFIYRCNQQMYALAFKMTNAAAMAEEVLEEVFVDIWNERELLPAVVHPLGYLYRKIFTTVIYFLKQNLREGNTGEAGDNGPSPSTGPDDEKPPGDTLNKMTNTAVKPPDTNDATGENLVHIVLQEDQPGYEEISRRLKKVPGVVKTHWYDTLFILRRYITRIS